MGNIKKYDKFLEEYTPIGYKSYDTGTNSSNNNNNNSNYNNYNNYEKEEEICEYLGLKVNSGQVMAYYGSGSSDGGKNIKGWQMVCHISKLKLYLTGKIHEEHKIKSN